MSSSHGKPWQSLWKRASDLNSHHRSIFPSIGSISKYIHADRSGDLDRENNLAEVLTAPKISRILINV
ncbi:hypothetical protein [Chamaesiphon minutus]|uniref:hypothetical protein n=1 Tax=Chamaesiphon minutus TaxID=1173032 RepID=UPI0002DF1CD3|nr:hypothetical protein [Chamaesiphon minutus]